MGTSLVYKEIDKRTLYTIISQPMHRYEFILGKYLGLMALLAVVTVVMAVVSSGYVLLLGGSVEPLYFLAVLLIYWKLMLGSTAVALLMSSLTSPILGAVIIVFSTYVFGHATGVFQCAAQFDGTLFQAHAGIRLLRHPQPQQFRHSHGGGERRANQPGLCGLCALLRAGLRGGPLDSRGPGL